MEEHLKPKHPNTTKPECLRCRPWSGYYEMLDLWKNGEWPGHYKEQHFFTVVNWLYNKVQVERVTPCWCKDDVATSH